mgnify:CR=1 FL=1
MAGSGCSDALSSGRRARRLAGAAGLQQRINQPVHAQRLAPGKKTKTGYSTDATTLEKLRDQWPHLKLFLREETSQAACDAHDAGYYPKFKAWADEYFFVPHRGRARGVGGIFYDDLHSGDWEADFAFTREVGSHFLPAFVPVTERRVNTPYSEADREAQLIHRGLYAEYNLVYDRGTKFGLETGHDANAVLMSLPPIAKWT